MAGTEATAVAEAPEWAGELPVEPEPPAAFVPPEPAPEPEPGPEPERPPELAGPAAPRGRTRLRILLVAGLAVPLGMVAVGSALGWLLRRDGLLPTLLGPQPWGQVLLWAAVGMALSLAVTTGLATLWPRLEKELERTGLQSGEEVLRLAGWPVMATVVAGAGLGEEVLFRGGLQPTLGVVPAALLFGLAHGGWNLREMWSMVLTATLAGLIFGTLYRQTGLLWAVVIAHAGHNLLVTLYLLYRRPLVHGIKNSYHKKYE